MHTLPDQRTRTVIALVLLRGLAEDASSASGHCPADVVEPGCHLLVKLGAARSTLKSARVTALLRLGVGVAGLAGMAVSGPVTLRGPMGWLCIRLRAAGVGLA